MTRITISQAAQRGFASRPTLYRATKDFAKAAQTRDKVDLWRAPTPACGGIAGRLIRIAEDKRLFPHAGTLPTDSTVVDKICALPDDRFQELLADGTIHPKLNRNAMAVHAAQES